MVSQLQPITEVTYPDSDGKPMADNTKQFRWIVVVQQNLEWLYADNPDVFVAGDLLWYPVEGNNKIRNAPDVFVALGRPKGDRGSYQQWKEANVPPQVVFEILSPGNRKAEMEKKLLFYDRHGVEEYYLYDPDTNKLEGWLRTDGCLEDIDPIENWVSPRLGVRFDLSTDELQIFRPDGDRFLSYTEIAQKAEESRLEAEQERQRAEQEKQRAEQERQRAEQERQRAEQLQGDLDQERLRSQALIDRLRAAGIDPNELNP
jgi:Uma2 family endonuclease